MLRQMLALLLLSTPALAEVRVEDARLVAAFPNAKAAALYLTIESDTPDVLIGVHTDEAMAMLHETLDDNGIMRMERVDQVAVQAGEPVEMSPGGLHVMVMGLTPQMLEAEAMSFKLILQDAGEIPLEAEIQIGVQGDG